MDCTAVGAIVGGASKAVTFGSGGGRLVASVSIVAGTMEPAAGVRKRSTMRVSRARILSSAPPPPLAVTNRTESLYPRDDPPRQIEAVSQNYAGRNRQELGGRKSEEVSWLEGMAVHEPI